MESVQHVKQLIEKDIVQLGFPAFQWVEEPELIAFYDVINPNFDEVVERLEQVYGDTERVQEIKQDLLHRKAMLNLLYGCEARIDVSLTRSFEGDIIVETYFFPTDPNHRRLPRLPDDEIFELYKRFFGDKNKEEIEKQELKRIFDPEESKADMVAYLWLLEDKIRNGVDDLNKLIFDTVRKKIRQRGELLVNN